jgi:hypothetical protein
MTVIYIYYVILPIVKRTTVKDVVDAECWRLHAFPILFILLHCKTVKWILTLQTAHLQIV